VLFNLKALFLKRNPKLTLSNEDTNGKEKKNKTYTHWVHSPAEKKPFLVFS
jgi:hypothetical protein